jgi:hypothetical protein
VVDESGEVVPQLLETALIFNTGFAVKSKEKIELEAAA